jgi:succinate dehydrogenase/fumarate reductase flavoprotein subunit
VPVNSERDPTRALARALLAGPTYCRLHRMPEDIRKILPQVSPNFMLPFVRDRIDPFGQKFEVTLRGEGTVRGTGGLRVIDDDCQTTVPGLFAAGDAATRELVAGATSGGGAQNSAWALSSGQWAGRGAAVRVRTAGRRADAKVEAIGQAGLRPSYYAAPVDRGRVIAGVQREVLPYDKNLFRTGAALRRSIAILDELWSEVRDHFGSEEIGGIKARETAALVACARWCYGAASARNESRGMHLRTDAGGEDARFSARLLVGGLDRVWTRLEQSPAQVEVVQ